MTWSKLDDGFLSNPKILALSIPARWIYVSSIVYANAQLTDGFIPAAAFPSLALGTGDPDGILTELTRILPRTENPLWEPVEGGWVIHDFLDYNPSRKAVEDKREAVSEERSKAGRIGAERRWQTDGKPMANAMANAKQNDGPVPGPVPVPLVNDDDVGPEPELDKDFGAIWSLYISEFLVNPASAVDQEIVGDLVKKCRDPGIHREAIKVARKGSDTSRPRLRYIESILESYLNTGSWDKPGGNGNVRSSPNRRGNGKSSPTDAEWQALADQYNDKPAPVSAV